MTFRDKLSRVRFCFLLFKSWRWLLAPKTYLPDPGEAATVTGAGLRRAHPEGNEGAGQALQLGFLPGPVYAWPRVDWVVQAVSRARFHAEEEPEPCHTAPAPNRIARPTFLLISEAEMGECQPTRESFFPLPPLATCRIAFLTRALSISPEDALCSPLVAGRTAQGLTLEHREMGGNKEAPHSKCKGLLTHIYAWHLLFTESLGQSTCSGGKKTKLAL